MKFGKQMKGFWGDKINVATRTLHKQKRIDDPIEKIETISIVTFDYYWNNETEVNLDMK